MKSSITNNQWCPSPLQHKVVNKIKYWSRSLNSGKHTRCSPKKILSTPERERNKDLQDDTVQSNKARAAGRSGHQQQQLSESQLCLQWRQLQHHMLGRSRHLPCHVKRDQIKLLCLIKVSATNVHKNIILGAQKRHQNRNMTLHDDSGWQSRIRCSLTGERAALRSCPPICPRHPLLRLLKKKINSKWNKWTLKHTKFN
jgi:hypothetical protein